MSFTTSWVIEVVDQSSAAFDSIGTKAETMATKIETSTEKTSVSMKDLGTSIAGVGTSAMALYNLYDRVDDASLRVQVAENRLADTGRRVKDMQDDVNAAVEKYGPASDEAVAALERLKAAQEDLVINQERAKEAHENYSESLASSAMMAIPACITAFSSLQSLVTTLGPALTGAAGGLSAVGAAMGGLVTAGAAVVGTMAGLAFSLAEWKERTGDWFTALDEVEKKIKNLPPVISDLVDVLAKSVTGWAVAFDKIKESVSGFIDWMKTTFDDFYNWLTGKTNEAADSTVEAFQDIDDRLSRHSLWPEMWGRMEDQAAEGLANIQSILAGGLGDFSATVKPVAEATALASPATSRLDVNITVRGATITDLQFADQVGREIAKLDALRGRSKRGWM